MSLRSIRPLFRSWHRLPLGLVLVLGLGLGIALAVGCGGSPSRTDEPTTAKEKQRREAEVSGTAEAPSNKGARWRYTGDRNACFFAVGGRCFKTEAAACSAARCGQRKCEVTGGGPATVACAKN